MPRQIRFETRYLGVYYVQGVAIGSRRPERIYYIRYYRNGKRIEEKAGRQFQDAMTPARAAGIRAERIEGKKLSRKEMREQEKAKREAEKSKWTISKLWIEYKQQNDIKGIVTDANRFRKHIEPIFGDKKPKEIIPLDIARLRIKLLKTLAPGTVKNILEILRRTINFGIDNRLCKGPGFKIEMPKVDNEKTEDLSTGQLARLLQAIEDDNHLYAGPLMKMALFTGLRRGELFNLQWSDIDFERGFIHIREPKGGKDQIIPLNDAARHVLKKHIRTESPYVFPGRGGKRRVDINKAVNCIKSAANLPEDFRPLHGLRHTFASMLASSGQVDMYVLQRLLTHKSPKTTQRYAHLRDETLKRASNLMNALLAEVFDSRVIPIKKD